MVPVRSAGLGVLSCKAVDLRMLRRLDLTSSVLEVYDQRVRPGEVQHSYGHPGREHVVVTERKLRVGPADSPSELGPGTTSVSRRSCRAPTRRSAAAGLRA
ncbi:hypothetical protein ACWDKQ_25655 [Saccharopolyspora sp. NPDC000995]